jgi:cytoplasmic iron level regulating protein YaaA (DUF328/UPF0246 family)
MLILLPPSEGKRSPAKNIALNLSSLSFSDSLTSTRKEELSLFPETQSLQTDLAINVYSGVLYQALDYQSMNSSAKKKANKSLLIISALFGVIRPEDEICTYKAKIKTSLWREPLKRALMGLDSALVVDMRSSTYATVWIPEPQNTVAIRIFTYIDGEKKVITHMSKKYRGEIARLLILNKSVPTTPQELKEIISTKYQCSLIEPLGKKSWFIDVIV